MIRVSFLFCAFGVGLGLSEIAIGAGGVAPTIHSFQAAPSEVVDGQPTTLSWSVSDANIVFIKGIGGMNGTTSILVTPAGVQTYTLVAKNDEGTTEKSVTVTTHAPGSRQKLRFQSGFGGTTSLISGNSQGPKIIGADQLPLSDWVSDLGNPAGLGASGQIFYEAGTEEDRIAEIIPEPNNPKNSVMHFRLSNPAILEDDGVPLKGRIQMSIGSKEKGMKEFYCSVRLFLHPDFRSLRNYPEVMNWLTISEWWNNGGWTGEAFPFRISVHIVKRDAAAGAPLHFGVQAEPYNETRGKWNLPHYWEGTSEETVPIGQWMTLEYYIREGDAKTGRFYMAMTPDGGSRKVLFDIRDYTHHAADPSPDGFKDINPMKLYTSNEVVEFVRSKKKSLQMYWDDLVLRVP